MRNTELNRTTLDRHSICGGRKQWRAALDTNGASIERQKWTRLAGAVLRQAIDDSERGEVIGIEDLQAWAVIAGVPLASLQQALRSAAESTPATAA